MQNSSVVAKLARRVTRVVFFGSGFSVQVSRLHVRVLHQKNVEEDVWWCGGGIGRGGLA